MDETLKGIVDAVTQKSESITFEIDVDYRSRLQRVKDFFTRKKLKREFEVKPLSLNQLYKVSSLLLDINLEDLTPTGVLKIMMNHSRTCAEVVAIAVTESKQNPSKQLIDVFFYNLSKDDLNTALRIVLQQMNTLDFLNTIVSVKSLNVLEMRKHAIAPSAETNETSPIVPGVLSEAS